MMMYFFPFFSLLRYGSWGLARKDLIVWWGFFHYVASWNYLNKFHWQFHAASRPRVLELRCADCWAVGNGLQGQAVHRASWGRVWWEGIAAWKEPEMTEENTQQHFAHSIEANVFLFHASHELTFVHSVPQVFGNLLRSSKWVTCSPFHLVCNLFLALLWT